MTFENMGPETYIRARAEQLAMQADLTFFQELYLARGINFGSEVGETARQAFDAFIAPFREIAIREFTEAHELATKNAGIAFAQTIENVLGKASLTGSHDAAEIAPDELAAFNEIIAESPVVTKDQVVKMFNQSTDGNYTSIEFSDPQN